MDRSRAAAKRQNAAAPGPASVGGWESRRTPYATHPNFRERRTCEVRGRHPSEARSGLQAAGRITIIPDFVRMQAVKCGCGSEKSQVPPASQLSPSRQSKSLSPFTHRTSVNHPDELDLVDAIYDRLPRMYLSSSSGDRCWDLDEHSDLRQLYIVGAQSCTATVRQRG